MHNCLLRAHSCSPMYCCPCRLPHLPAAQLLKTISFPPHVRRARTVVLYVAWLVALIGLPVTIKAQQHTAPDARAQAVIRRDSGDLRGAAALLRAHLEAHPDDGDALRLLAETLYQLKDFSGARRASERGLIMHPEDTELRLQYAQMLIETGFATRAREVLGPAGSESQATRGRANAILGTLAYWEGDLAGANTLTASAIGAGDRDPAIKRIHADIAVLTAPWISVTPGYQHDDQPVDRTSLAARAGWFPLASTSVTVHAEGLRFQLSDTASRTASVADITLSHYAAAARTDLTLSAGATARSFGSSSDAIGTASVAVRLPAHVKLGARVDRSPYFETEASLSEAVMTNTGIAYAHLDHPAGWIGEAAFQIRKYPDSNTLTNSYVWLLAPLLHSPMITLRGGYSGSLQNSSESRFTLANSSQAYLPGDARFDLTGRYRPYYTPIDLQTHSAIGSLEAHLNSTVSFSANGSYSFRATESHPALVAVTTLSSPAATTIQQISYARTFNPWTAHASLQMRPSADVSIIADGNLFRTGFYSASGASLSFVYRFASRAITKAGGY